MDPLDGPRLKIRRAKTEIERLRELEKSFRRDADYQVVRAEMNQKSGKYVYRARVINDPSLDEWGVWIGEIVHNLRSALDGLVYQLALLNGAPASARDTQFPIFRYRYTRKIGGKDVMGFEGYRGAKRPAGGSGRKMVQRLKPSHQAIIERLQPYRRNGYALHPGRRLNGRWNLLFRLSELNNADKHRLLQTLGAKSGAGPMYGGWGEGIEDEVIYGRLQIIKDGTKIMEAPANVTVDSQFLPLISFWEGCEAVQNVGVCYLLTLLVEQVTDIIDSFKSEF